MVISKKTIIFQGFRGGGGSSIFQEGVGRSKCYTFLKKPIKYVIFEEAPGNYPTSGPANVSFCPKFWTGPRQLEKMPSNPVAAKCIIYILC